MPDFGLKVGMSSNLPRLDLESAAAEIKAAGFDGMEIHISQAGPDLPGVPMYERHAAAAGELVRRAGLVVSTLNVVADPSFDPFGGRDALERTIAEMARHLRLAAAMGAPRLLIYEGRVAEQNQVSQACRTLAAAVEQAQQDSGLSNPPPVSVECHPYTFGLHHRRLGELAEGDDFGGWGHLPRPLSLWGGAGADFLGWIDDTVLGAINHVHYADTDCVTSELHYPPGQGVLDFGAIARRLDGKRLTVSWDLCGWPAPRRAVREQMAFYGAFVQEHARG